MSFELMIIIFLKFLFLQVRRGIVNLRILCLCWELRCSFCLIRWTMMSIFYLKIYLKLVETWNWPGIRSESKTEKIFAPVFSNKYQTMSLTFKFWISQQNLTSFDQDFFKYLVLFRSPAGLVNFSCHIMKKHFLLYLTFSGILSQLSFR